MIAIVQESKGEYDGYISSSPVGLMERLNYIFVLLVVVSFYVIIQESKGKYAGYMSVLVGLMDMLTRGIALIGLLWGLLLRHSRVEGQGAYDASISFSVYGDAYI